MTTMMIMKVTPGLPAEWTALFDEKLFSIHCVQLIQ